MTELIINSQIQSINATKKFGDKNIDFNFQKDGDSFVNNIITFSVNKELNTENSTDIASPVVPMMGISGNFNIETNKIFIMTSFEVNDDNQKLFKEIISIMNADKEERVKEVQEVKETKKGKSKAVTKPAEEKLQTTDEQIAAAKKLLEDNNYNVSARQTTSSYRGEY